MEQPRVRIDLTDESEKRVDPRIQHANTLPMWALRPKALDWNFKTRLVPAQKELLVMFDMLTPERKAELIHGVKPEGFIEGNKIIELFRMQEAQRQRGADAGALKNTTDSDLA